MKSNKKRKWIFLVILMALLTAGGLMAWAAPPDNRDGEAQPVAEPARPDSGRVAVPVSMPVSIPRVVPRIAMDAELIGTAVVEGGTSYAVFQSAGGTRMVREGDEIADGVRLVQVRKNRVDVESNGIQQEIRLGYSEGARHQVRPGSNPAGSGREARARLRDHLRATGRL